MSWFFFIYILELHPFCSSFASFWGKYISIIKKNPNNNFEKSEIMFWERQRIIFHDGTSTFQANNKELNVHVYFLKNSLDVLSLSFFKRR